MDSGTKHEFHGTTVFAIRRQGKAVIAADGQVTLGNTVVKHKAKKIRRLYNDTILAGFAGSTADAITLFEKFQGRLEEYSGNLVRAAVELAKEWRTDKYLRNLNALLLVVDKERGLMISGTGDVIEPDDECMAIGSGGAYALAAGRALCRFTDLSAQEIARAALETAADICIYTNKEILVDEI
jgi:ATP-dependent HslUV protease subunit HslV